MAMMLTMIAAFRARAKSGAMVLSLAYLIHQRRTVKGMAT